LFAAEDDRGGEVRVCGTEVWRGAATATGTGEVEVDAEVCGGEAGCGVTIAEIGGGAGGAVGAAAETW